MTTNTDHQPLTDEQLAEIDARAAGLFEYVTLPSEADQLAGVDVPALLAEVKRLREQVEVTRRVGEAETTRAAYEAMDTERRGWESRRAVENVTLADLRRERDRARDAAVALEQENARLREHIAFVLTAARERDAEMLHLRDTHKASKRTQTRGHAWEEAAYEVRKIAELLERVDSPA